MARGWPGDRAGDRLDESLVRLKGLAAATSAIGVAVEKERDACPLLHDVLHTLGMLALDEVEVVEKASEELWQELRAAKGVPEPQKRKDQARTG
jgi:hypothetical protein